MTKHTKDQSTPLQSSLLEQNTQLFFETLCQNVGENSNREGLLRTPERIAQSLSTMLNGYVQSPKEALGSIFDCAKKVTFLLNVRTSFVTIFRVYLYWIYS